MGKQMSLEQIFKVIFEITTVRRSFAGLTMVCGVVLSLHYVDPALRVFIPNATEMSSLLSFLGGSFGGYLVYSALLKIYLLTLNRNKKRREETLERLRVSTENEQKALKLSDSLSRFKSTYTHLNEIEIDTIRLLTEKDGHELRNDNYTLRQLGRNNWIWRVSELSATRGIYKVHGYIAKYVVEQWDNEIKTNIDNFYNLENPLKDILLKLLAKENEIKNFEYKLYPFYEDKNSFPKIFSFKTDRSGGTIEFEHRYKEALEEKYPQKFSDSVSVKFI